jgi:Helix-turn-helix domain
MELLDEHSAARYLGGAKPLSVRTVQRMRVTGTGPRFIKVGAAVRYTREDLDEFLNHHRRSSTSAIERDPAA